MQLFLTDYNTDASLPVNPNNQSRSQLETLPGHLSPPATPSSSSSPLPLTEDNLRKLHQENGDMAEFTTPPSKRKSDTTSNHSKHVEDVRQILRLNHMNICVIQNADDTPSIVANAVNLLEGTRQSPQPKTQREKIQTKVNMYGTQNDTTFPFHFWPVFFNVDRIARPLVVPHNWEQREWVEDGLFQVFDKLMRQKSAVQINTWHAAHKAILAKLPKISTPKPDILCGERSRYCPWACQTRL
ncbi:MAG: hypothetical protein Q9213_008377 [Squamulea squamosa]